MATSDRRSFRTRVNTSQQLTELRQRAETRIQAWEGSGLAGDRQQALQACQQVVEQAAKEKAYDLEAEFLGRMKGLQ